MRRNLDFFRTLPGFRGHVTFEKSGGPSTFNLVTVAAWENREALDATGKEMRAYYQRIGFDMPATLQRWGGPWCAPSTRHRRACSSGRLVTVGERRVTRRRTEPALHRHRDEDDSSLLNRYHSHRFLPPTRRTHARPTGCVRAS
jgi:hypothetical protein